MKNLAFLIFKQIYLRFAIIVFCYAFFILSPFKSIIFSIGCHTVGLIFYKEYNYWLTDIYLSFKKTNAKLFESSTTLYHLKMVLVMFFNIFVFGVYEIFFFMQAKSAFEEVSKTK